MRIPFGARVSGRDWNKCQKGGCSASAEAQMSQVRPLGLAPWTRAGQRDRGFLGLADEMVRDGSLEAPGGMVEIGPVGVLEEEP